MYLYSVLLTLIPPWYPPLPSYCLTLPIILILLHFHLVVNSICYLLVLSLLFSFLYVHLSICRGSDLSFHSFLEISFVLGLLFFVLFLWTVIGCFPFLSLNLNHILSLQIIFILLLFLYYIFIYLNLFITIILYLFYY